MTDSDLLKEVLNELKKSRGGITAIAGGLSEVIEEMRDVRREKDAFIETPMPGDDSEVDDGSADAEKERKATLAEIGAAKKLAAKQAAKEVWGDRANALIFKITHVKGFGHAFPQVDMKLLLQAQEVGIEEVLKFWQDPKSAVSPAELNSHYQSQWTGSENTLLSKLRQAVERINKNPDLHQTLKTRLAAGDGKYATLLAVLNELVMVKRGRPKGSKTIKNSEPQKRKPKPQPKQATATNKRKDAPVQSLPAKKKAKTINRRMQTSNDEDELDTSASDYSP